jgi:Raf kinase inhibitor-like YbhB/YbcL family protein
VTLTIVSSAFGSGGWIPDRHVREGGDVSPPLSWSGVPRGTAQLALVCHDPDAPRPYGFYHWAVYGVPPSVTELAEAGGTSFIEGRNDFGDHGYGGPHPPVGHGVHHYFFWLYALDRELGSEPGLSARQLLDLLDGHVLEQNRVVGVYER